MSNSFEDLLAGLKSVIGMIKDQHPEQMSTVVFDVFGPEINAFSDSCPDVTQEIIDHLCISFIEREGAKDTSYLTKAIAELNEILEHSHEVVEREAEIRQKITELMMDATSGKYSGEELVLILQSISQLSIHVENTAGQDEYRAWVNAQMKSAGVCNHDYMSVGMVADTDNPDQFIVTKKCVHCGDKTESMVDHNPYTDMSDDFMDLANAEISQS